MNSRPLGVSILGGFLYLNAAVYVVILVLSVVNRSIIQSLLEGLTPAGAIGPTALLRLGALLPVYFLGMAVITALLGWGFWKLKNWARIIIILLVAASLLASAARIAVFFSTMILPDLLISCARMGVALLVLWYLYRPGVKAAFGAASRSAAAA